MCRVRIFIALITTIILLSCVENNKNNSENKESSEHNELTDVVKLNKLQRDAINLKLGAFQMRNINTMVRTNGQLEVLPNESANVTAIIGGNVKEIKVFNGDKVKKGQVLATLEHLDYISIQEDFATTANQLEFIELEYKRQKELFENNIGAGKEYQKIKSEYNSLKARYKGLEKRLILLGLSAKNIKEGNISSVISIVSPISGFVSNVNINVGAYVDTREELFKIIDNSKIHADFNVYENDVHLLEIGQKINFTVSNYPNKELTATIFAINKEFDTKNRSLRIHANIENEKVDLIPGMYVSGNINTDNNFVQTLPNDAIVTEGMKSYIFVLDDNSILEKHSDNKEEQHSELENDTQTFIMVEVAKGKQNEKYTEVRLMSELPQNTKIVLNAAYYMLADMKKEETEHEH